VHRELSGEIRSLVRMATALKAESGDGQVGPSLVGATIHDYRIVRELGRGAVGVVYEANDRKLDRSVALKVLAAHAATRPELQRFRREALALARARHPHITAIHDVGVTAQGLPYLVTDLVRGASLDERLKAIEAPDPAALQRRNLLTETGRLEHMNIEVRLRVVGAGGAPSSARDGQAAPAGAGAAGPSGVGAASARGAAATAARQAPPASPRPAAARLNSFVATIVRIGAKVADALDHAHQAGVVHRDVKPANILIDPNGEPHLVDFGLAFGVGKDSVTFTAALQGTPLYMAPEQVANDRDAIGPRTDVYALGVTLYHCLALRPPFEGQSSSVLFSRIQNAHPPALRALNRAVPATVDAVIMKAMEKRPDRRYVSAAAFRDDLQAALEGRPVQARPPGPWRRAGEWLVRHPASVTLAGLLLLLASAVAAAYVSALAIEGRGAQSFTLPWMPGTTVTLEASPTPR
jgi:serine/threonine protein kinase